MSPARTPTTTTTGGLHLHTPLLCLVSAQILCQILLVVAAAQQSQVSAGPSFKLTSASAASSSSSTSEQQQQQQQQVSSSYLSNFNLNEPTASGTQEDGRDNLYLLGLFDVHAAASRRAGPFKCGPIDADAGETSSRRPMQNLWAFLWAIEQVNADSSLLPGVRLGSLVLDTCSSFLRTNQQLANLLQGESGHAPGGGQPWTPRPGELPRARQLVGVVADQHDWRSVEATASMASARGLLTLVTQSRSTKLSEFARAHQQPDGEGPPLPAAAQSQPQAQRLSAAAAAPPSDELLLRELLGIGRMLPPEAAAEMATTNVEDSPATSSQLLMIRMAQSNELIAEALASLCERLKWDLVSVIYDPGEVDLVDLHDELIRQLLLRNIQLAVDEQISAAVVQAKPTTPGGDATPPTTSGPDAHERLLVTLARQVAIGSRVVISLLGIGSARQLQAKLHAMRGASNQSGQQQQQLKALNSLLWLTTADREPYYTYATDSLGVISASSASSLLPEFKQFYDSLQQQQQAALELGGGGVPVEKSTSSNTTTTAGSGQAQPQAQPQNRWWPEYVRAVMLRHKRELGELLVNECARWQEPRASPLRDKCARLSLASLVQTERLAGQTRARLRPAASAPAQPGDQAPKAPPQATSGTSSSGNKLALGRYLASGWEHNGMEVINSVLALANGLESVRQSLCPETPRGLCARMRDLVRLERVALPGGVATSLQDDAGPEVAAGGAVSSAAQLVELPTLSELVHGELVRSTFQLADGQQMFSLAGDYGGAGAGLAPADTPPTGASQQPATTTTAPPTQSGDTTRSQLDTRLKFYNLRFLRPNSIGFVKFAQYSGGGSGGGLALLNSSRALHYANIPLDYADARPLEQVNSTCQDERKCLMLSALLGEFAGQESAASKSNQSAASGDRRPLPAAAAISEEELAHGVNSLFKLDHPLIVSGHQQTPPLPPSSTGGHSSSAGGLEQQQQLSLLTIRTMRADKWPALAAATLRDPFGPAEDTEAESPSDSGSKLVTPASSGAVASQRQFEVLVLLPLARRRERRARTSNGGSWLASCPRTSAEEARAFQQLAALAYGQSAAEVASGGESGAENGGGEDNKSTSGGDGHKQRQQRAVELTITVIDYCERATDALEGEESDSGGGDAGDNLIEQQVARKLTARASESGASPPPLVAIVDFDWRVGQRVERLLQAAASMRSDDNKPPLHLTLDHRRSHEMAPPPGRREELSSNNHNHLHLMPSKAREIATMVAMIRSVPQWRLVHLVYLAHEWELRDEFIRQANEARLCVSKLISVPDLTLSSGGGGDGTRDESGATPGGSGQMRTQLRALFERELYDFSNGRSSSSSEDFKAAGDLNATRLLVVLAGEHAPTNRLVLEAATPSMLQDYVWLTSHEWLASVEDQEEARKPRLFLSTRIEPAGPEAHNFRLFLGHLTPALHAQLPTDWFDRFWEAHFRCRLPMAGGGNFASQPQTPCSPHNHHHHHHHQQLELGTDERALQLARAVAALRVALSLDDHDDLWKFNDNFRRAFATAGASPEASPEAVSVSAGSGMRPLARHQEHPVDFHIVHRLLHTTSAWAPRRANSRQLEPPGQLVYVNPWPRGLVGAPPTVWSRNSKRKFAQQLDNSSQVAADWTAETENSSGDAGRQRALERTRDSLAQLTGIKSRCVSNATCALCRHQFALAREIARRATNQWRPAQPLEPTAHAVLAPGTSLASDLASDDYEDEPPPQQQEGTAASTQLDDIQAAASSSSLFDARTSQLVASELEAAAAAHARSLAQRQQRFTSGGGGIPFASAGRGRLSGALLSVLSLVGVLFTVASMTHFYPSLLDRRQALGGGGKSTSAHLFGLGGDEHDPSRAQSSLQSSFRSTSSSTCNILAAGDHAHAQSPGGSLLAAVLANTTDYLLLTGLLMLHSINIAFLLPATLSVCYFRRIGLALSYTVLFGALLAKVQEVQARARLVQRRRREQSTSARSSSSSNSSSADSLVAGAGQRRATVRASHASLESVDESVEVTFESLPHEISGAGEFAAPAQQVGAVQCGPTSEPEVAAHHSDELALEFRPGHHLQYHERGAESPTEPQTTTDCFKLPLALIGLQLVVSLVWLVRQPPEPTLLHACWHCASLMRSPLLFLYEPLVSLAGPALILVAAWLWSIGLFNWAHAQEREFASASRAFILSQPLSFALTNAPEYARHKRRQASLASLARDSKLLVVTTTLLVLAWSLAALSLIASSQSLLSTLSAGSMTRPFVSMVGGSGGGSTHTDDQSLVYANLFSGALVFALLFVYRLRLFSVSSLRFTTPAKSDYDQISSASLAAVAGHAHRRPQRAVASVKSISRRLKSLGRSRRFATCGSGGVPAGSGLEGPQSGAASGSHAWPAAPASRQQAERLKLQQFNMTYGTYAQAEHSAVAAAAAAGAVGAATSGASTTSLDCVGGGQQVATPTQSNRSGSSRSLFKLGSGKRVTGDKNNNNHSERGVAGPQQQQQSAKGAKKAKGKRQQQQQQQQQQMFSASRRSLNGSLNGLTLNGPDSDFELDELDDRLDGHAPHPDRRATSRADPDAISCASNATSQLQGNDLYPIDCSIQLVEGGGGGGGAEAAVVGRPHSRRRSERQIDRGRQN